MKLLLLGSNTYPAQHFLNNLNKLISVTNYNKRFEHIDILNLDNQLFFDKYFSSINDNFEYSLNFVYIHDTKKCSTIEINKKLTEKLIFTFTKLQIRRNIYISSVNSFKQATTDYGKAKFYSEEIYKSISNSLVIRPSTIIDIDYQNRKIKGGKKGKSFDGLDKLISKSLIIPVPGFGNYPQTICFVDDLAKFIECTIINNYFPNKTINFFSGEIISYNEFLNIYFEFKKIKRFKLYIPKILILFTIKLLKLLVPNLNLSSKNIDNLTNQKIEFNFSQDINNLISLKKIRNINKIYDLII